MRSKLTLNLSTKEREEAEESKNIDCDDLSACFEILSRSKASIIVQELDNNGSHEFIRRMSTKPGVNGKFRMNLMYNLAIAYKVMTDIQVQWKPKSIRKTINQVHTSGCSNGRKPRGSKSIVEYFLELRTSFKKDPENQLEFRKYNKAFNKARKYCIGTYNEHTNSLWGKYGRDRTEIQQTDMLRVFFRWTCIYPDNLLKQPQLCYYLQSFTLLKGSIKVGLENSANKKK